MSDDAQKPGPFDEISEALEILPSGKWAIEDDGPDRGWMLLAKDSQPEGCYPDEVICRGGDWDTLQSLLVIVREVPSLLSELRRLRELLEQHDRYDLGGGWSIGRREPGRWVIYYVIWDAGFIVAVHEGRAKGYEAVTYPTAAAAIAALGDGSGEPFRTAKAIRDAELERTAIR